MAILAGGGWIGAGSGASLYLIEGEVTAIGTRIAEGDLPVLSIEVSKEGKPLHLLLAPGDVLEQIGFEIEVGDIVRARSFEPDSDAVAYVQKIMNVTRGEMVRLRTLRADPLWDSAGRWQGSGGGRHRGGERAGTGRRHRGGR
jgi:hypothetical protein